MDGQGISFFDEAATQPMAPTDVTVTLGEHDRWYRAAVDVQLMYKEHNIRF